MTRPVGTEFAVTYAANPQDTEWRQRTVTYRVVVAHDDGDIVEAVRVVERAVEYREEWVGGALRWWGGAPLER